MGLRQFATFRIDSHLLGLDIMTVREVNKALDITPVHHAPHFVRGFLNLRGQILTIFDLGLRLGLGRRTLSEESYNVILKGEAVGLIVDAMDEIVTADEAQFEAMPGNTSAIDRDFIEGVVKLPHELLVVLSTEAILEHELTDSGSA